MNRDPDVVRKHCHLLMGHRYTNVEQGQYTAFLHTWVRMDVSVDTIDLCVGPSGTFPSVHRLLPSHLVTFLSALLGWEKHEYPTNGLPAQAGFGFCLPYVSVFCVVAKQLKPLYSWYQSTHKCEWIRTLIMIALISLFFGECCPHQLISS
jgi:hypothetical protein